MNIIMNMFIFRIKRCHKRKLIIVLLLVVHCFHFWSCPLLYHKQSYWHVGMEELQVPERYMYINIIVHILYWHGYMPPIPQRFACELRCTRASTVYIYIIYNLDEVITCAVPHAVVTDYRTVCLSKW